MILNLHAIEWFQLSALLTSLTNQISPIIIIYNSELQEQLNIFKNLQYSDNKKCIRLLRPWPDAKHCSTSKTVFIKMSAGVDLSVRTHEDQIWAHARFINEAPNLCVEHRLFANKKDYYK